MKSQQWGSPPGASGSGLQQCWSWTSWAHATNQAQALQKRLLARLPSWAKSMTNWSPEDFAMRSRLRWQCIDCAGHCNLDESLAEHVEKLVKAPFS